MRRPTTFTIEAFDTASLFVYSWLLERPAKAVVQIAHGCAEHAGRYARVTNVGGRDERVLKCPVGNLRSCELTAPTRKSFEVGRPRAGNSPA